MTLTGCGTVSDLRSFSEPRHDASVRWHRYVYAVIALWSVGLGLLAWWGIERQRADTLELARSIGRTVFEQEVLVRRWISEHGGAYMEVGPRTQPNPYLTKIPERDITTPSGKRLTLVNPSVATRQLHEMQRDDGGVIGHLTSLHPLRPENGPDPWETDALQAFAAGQREVSAVASLSGKPYLRIMRPLFAERSCAQCHAAEGFKTGDVQGGLSVSLPMQPFLAASDAAVRRLAVGYGLIWLAGFGVMGAGALRLRAQFRARQRLEQALLGSERKFRQLFESAPGPVLLLDIAGRVIDCNSAAVSILGAVSKEQVCNRQVAEISPEWQPDGAVSAPRAQQLMRQAMDGTLGAFAWTHRRFDGTDFIVDVAATPVTVGTGRALLVQWHDVTQQKRLEEELRTSAVVDELTGLYNRRGLHALAEQQIRLASRSGRSLALIFADLDGMKRINDRFGHTAGDAALRDVADLLRGAFRTDDIVGRLGGDEFVGIVLESSDCTGQLITDRLQTAIEQLNRRPGRIHPLSLSVGVAYYLPTAPCSLGELLEQGDRAMYAQKQARKRARES